MANGPLDDFMAAVMALRAAYIAERRAREWAEAPYEPEGDEVLERLMQARADFYEHMRTR